MAKTRQIEENGCESVRPTPVHWGLFVTTILSVVGRAAPGGPASGAKALMDGRQTATCNKRITDASPAAPAASPWAERQPSGQSPRRS